MESSATSESQSVNVKSTKQEIYDAYRALLKQHREHAVASEDPKQASAREADQRTLESVVQFRTGTSVATAIGQARDALNRELDAVQREMEERSRASAALEAAIRIQESRLKEWYDVERAAQDLLALLRAREEQERAYATEDTHRKEQRKRDEDAYRYEVEQRKRADEEERRVRMQQFDETLRVREEALAKRETLAKEREEEYARLTTEAKAFPQRLDGVRQQAREEAEARMAKEAETERRFAQKELESRQAIAQSRIDASEQTIERQHQQLRDLQAQLQSALAQVQEVTLKTIEGSSDHRAFQAVQKFAAQQRAPSGDVQSHRAS